MRIAIKGRNTPVTDDIRDYVERRFGKIAKQVSPLAVLEVEVKEERNPAIADSQVAEVTLHLKGVTLRARDASRHMINSINLCADELARQARRQRDSGPNRRKAGPAAVRGKGCPAC